MKIAPLVDLFFKDMSWDSRVYEIAKCGYKYVETWQGEDAYVLKLISDTGRDYGVELVSVVINFATEEKVAPISKENNSRFLEQVDRISDNALSVGCHQGIITTGQSISGHDYQQQRSALVSSLRQAGEMVTKKGFHLNLELLNTEVDHPGYFLNSPFEGISIIKEVGLDNVKMLYDFYHMGIMTGNITSFVTNNISYIGHFHIAGIPGRHEPFLGELNYLFLLQKTLESGYSNFFGLEYMPKFESPETLLKTLKYFQGE